MHAIVAAFTPIAKGLSAFQKRFFLLALAIALALASHLIFLHLLPAPWQKNESADFRVFYGPVARQLAAGHGFYLPSGKPAIKYPPGIPIIYGATFWISGELGWSEERGLRVMEALLTLSTTVLVAIIGLEFLGARVGLLACLLWSTYPFHLWMSKQPSGEALACVFLLLSVLAFLRWSREGRGSTFWGSACGVVVAIAALTKPFHIALAAVFVVLAWICDVPVRRAKRALFSLCVVAAFALAILPWEVWASRTAGHFVPLCSNDVASLVDGITFGVGRAKVQRTAALPHAVAEVANDFAARRRTLASNRQVARLLFTHLREKPSHVALLFVTKAIRCWYANDSHRHESWTALIQMFYLPLFIAGGFFAWRRGRRYRNFLLLAAMVSLYYWGMTTMAALAIVRYMVPATSLLMVLAANALDVTSEAFGWRTAWVKSTPPAGELS